MCSEPVASKLFATCLKGNGLVPNPCSIHINSCGLQFFWLMLRLHSLAGVLVPDIPLEETAAVRKVASAHGLELVLLTTPTTPRERAIAIANATQGFLYLVSVAGICMLLMPCTLSCLHFTRAIVGRNGVSLPTKASACALGGFACQCIYL